MKSEKKYLRQCVSCKAHKDRDELIRITKNSNTGEIKINYQNDIQGRSVYICRNSECINIAVKKKKIENSLKSNISENIKNELQNLV